MPSWLESVIVLVVLTVCVVILIAVALRCRGVRSPDRADRLS